MEKVFGDKKAIFLFVAPAFIIYVFIVILPIFYSTYYSTMSWDGFGAKTFIGIQNYINLFYQNSDGFISSIFNSLTLAALSVFVQLPLALIFALILSRGIKGENFFKTVYFIPVILSTVVIGQLWNNVFDNRDFGLANFILGKFGLIKEAVPWLGDEKTALICVFIPIVWQFIGQHMLLMYASAKSIPDEIYEAAKIDGASSLKTALKVTIPLMAPIIKVCVTLAIIGSLKYFDLIFVMTRGGPLHATELPSTMMFSTIFAKYQYGYGSAMAIFIIVECLVLSFVIQKAFKKKEVNY